VGESESFVHLVRAADLAVSVAFAVLTSRVGATTPVGKPPQVDDQQSGCEHEHADRYGDAYLVHVERT